MIHLTYSGDLSIDCYAWVNKYNPKEDFTYIYIYFIWIKLTYIP